MSGKRPSGGDKTVLITGATSGIGRETARALALDGFHVVIIGRRPEATATTAAWLREQTHNPRVDFLVADLTSQAEVKRVAREFHAEHQRLDVLINNAGGVFPSWQLTEDGVERTWALNHLAPILLATELEPLLRASAPSRIVNVASSAHSGGRIDLDHQHDEATFSMSAYANAKLANVLATFALSRRLAGTGITVNCLHPGVVASSFGRSAGGWIKATSVLLFPFLLTPRRGAATSVHLATSPELEQISGEFFAKGKLRRAAPSSYDEALQDEVWRAAMRELGQAPASRKGGGPTISNPPYIAPDARMRSKSTGPVTLPGSSGSLAPS